MDRAGIATALRPDDGTTCSNLKPGGVVPAAMILFMSLGSIPRYVRARQVLQ